MALYNFKVMKKLASPDTEVVKEKKKSYRKEQVFNCSETSLYRIKCWLMTTPIRMPARTKA